MGAYVWTIFGVGVGFVLGFGYSSLRPTKMRGRRGPARKIVARQIQDRARFVAFSDMYRNYENPYEMHYLTAQDCEDVMQITVKSIAGYYGDQSLLYQQAGLDQLDTYERIAASGVEEASRLFLSI